MPSNRDRIALAVTALVESFGRSLSKATLAIWVQALGELDPAAVERAAINAIQSSRQMPSVAELRELAGAVRSEDRALLAWGAVEQSVVRVGAYRHVSFDDPVINATIRSLGGWVAVCSKPAEEFDKWGRQDFVKTYAALSRSGVTGEMCAPLPGLATGGMVRRIDGTIGEAAPQVKEIATGLPWAGEAPKRLDGPKPRPKAPAQRLEFKQP